MQTFNEFSQHRPGEDNVTDIVESILSGTTAKVAAAVIVAKISQIGRNIQSPDGKATSSQLVLLAALVLLAINTVSEPQPGRR
jgi:hypothetical protein